MWKWLFAITLTALGASLAVYPMFAQPEPKEPTVPLLMKKKLEYAQQLLETLTLNDLPAASKQAENLIRIRREAGFRIIKTPEYEHWAESFNTSAEGIVKAAKEGNLEAAKLHYLGVTMSCFNCHTYARDLRKRG